MKPHEKRLFTVNEIEKMYSISKSFLGKDRMEPKPMIPFIRIGRSVRYRIEDVEQFLDENRVV